MCAAVTCPPIREPYHYNPLFKVEVCLYQPLWPAEEVLYDVMAACGQLDLLCAREISQAKKERRALTRLSESFTDKAQIVAEQLHSLAARLPNGNLAAYMDANGLNKLYPRACQYIVNPHSLSQMENWSPMEDHTEALSALHRLYGMAEQLHKDMESLDNHKYIAHQMALLHQCLSSMSQVRYMSEMKQNIEQNFPAIKQSISDLQEEGKTPHLPTEQRQWLLDVTSRIQLICRNPPVEILECLQPAAHVLRQTYK